MGMDSVSFLRSEPTVRAIHDHALSKGALTARDRAPSPPPRRNRRDEPPAPLDPIDPKAPADLRYRLATAVPAQWIPLVPIAKPDRRGGFVLRKGTMSDVDASAGRLLDHTPFTLQEEEVPREGVRVRRVPALLRTTDGRRVRWIARRVSVGLGEGSSGLAFDGATR